MLDLNTNILVNGEHTTTIAAFLADNADGFVDCEALNIMMFLTEDGVYEGGGGVMAGFTLRVVEG